MYRIHQIKLPINAGTDCLGKKAAKILGLNQSDIKSIEIYKRSIDARKKDDVNYVYAVDVEVYKNSNKKFKQNEVSIIDKKEFIIKKIDNSNEKTVIIGLGPAGLFAGYVLAKAGLKPVIFERGKCCAERQKDINNFFTTGKLEPDSNVCFGEGGAGTFSDGKLNTLIKDREGFSKFVLKTFVEFGAQEDILYDAKPHIGTDRLVDVVSNMRRSIEELGGEVHFESKLEKIEHDGNKFTNLIINGNKITADRVILATGHSARDTFEMLYSQNFTLNPKAYAIGVRVLHSQELINKSQYKEEFYKLPAASYKLTHTCRNGRGVYSFCMCPGGYVVNASSEEEYLTVNGMSYASRDGNTANAAIVVTVSPEDFLRDGFENTPLCGMYFQRKYEKLAYNECQGRIIAQKLKDFINNKPSDKIPEGLSVKGMYKAGNINNCLPDYVCKSISEGMCAFDRKIHGFGDDETILLGIETRTSSPVRIERDESYQSNIRGIYPCGEGAGYAGGIMSAAIDGIKIACRIINEME
ncbi:MAG: FAD-dependent oxidoreductase [Clostridiales bacterium]|nr:FAD-dependent oxidoreductase [Clostridiales bacterium]